MYTRKICCNCSKHQVFFEDEGIYDGCVCNDPKADSNHLESCYEFEHDPKECEFCNLEDEEVFGI